MMMMAARMTMAAQMKVGRTAKLRLIKKRFLR